jgi:hypothetical protein
MNIFASVTPHTLGLLTHSRPRHIHARISPAPPGTPIATPYAQLEQTRLEICAADGGNAISRTRPPRTFSHARHATTLSSGVFLLVVLVFFLSGFVFFNLFFSTQSQRRRNRRPFFRLQPYRVHFLFSLVFFFHVYIHFSFCTMVEKPLSQAVSASNTTMSTTHSECASWNTLVMAVRLSFVAVSKFFIPLA